MRNIEQHYLVVGLLERMRETMAVLECALPHYFKGLLALYDLETRKAKSVKNRTRHLTVPSPHTREILRQWYSREYELLAWITQRFDNQVRAYKLKCPHLAWDVGNNSRLLYPRTAS